LIDPSVVYRPRIRTMLAETYLQRQSIFRNPRSKYDWDTIDEFLVSGSQDLVKDLRYWRARFVLIPVEPPKSSRGLIGSYTEVSDEEIRLEGIQRLTQIWQRYRYLPPEERHYHASVQHRTKDPNPLAIDYQTRDPSVVVRAHTSGLPSLQHGEMQMGQFAEADQIHINDIDIHKLAQRMQLEPPKGLVVVDRRWHWKLYHRCFRGDEFCSWLLANAKDLDTRDDAVRLGNDLMKKGLFLHVQHKHHFRDGNYFYQISSEYRSTSHPDTRANWLSRITSVPSTPALEESKGSPISIRSQLRLSNDSSSDSSGARTPTKGEKTLELSRLLRYDVDPRRRSWRPEIINLHYDSVHNPENCYHILLEWLNVTSNLIEDAIITWATSAERYGLKLVELPIAEASTINEQHPFRATYRVVPVIRPPTPKSRHYFDATSLSSQTHEDKFAHEKALLRKWDFVLDLEAASSFDQTEVEVTYSWGKPDYRYTQFIHKTGGVLAQIDENGDFLLLANRLDVQRAASIRNAGKRFDMDKERHTGHAIRSPYASPLVRAADVPLPPTPGLSATRRDVAPTGTFTEIRIGHNNPIAEEIKEAFEKFCHSEAELQAFYEDALKPSASPSPRVGPLSPRHTPLMRGVYGLGSSLLKPESDSDIPAFGLPEGKLALGAGHRAASYAAGTVIGATNGGNNRKDEDPKSTYEGSRRASTQGP